MKAAVLHAFDEKLTSAEFVKFEDVADPKISRPMDVIVRMDFRTNRLSIRTLIIQNRITQTSSGAIRGLSRPYG